MKTAMMSGLLAAMLIAASLPATAGGRDRHGVKERQHHQQHAYRAGERVAPAGDGQAHRDSGRHWHRDHRHAGYQPAQGWQGDHHGWRGSTRAFDRRYDHAQHDQRHLIMRGVRSGELTRHEAGRLMAEQRSLEAQERRYLADGSLSRAERADMLQDLTSARQHIYNEIHDDQTRR